MEYQQNCGQKKQILTQNKFLLKLHSKCGHFQDVKRANEIISIRQTDPSGIGATQRALC